MFLSWKAGVIDDKTMPKSTEQSESAAVFYEAIIKEQNS